MVARHGFPLHSILLQIPLTDLYLDPRLPFRRTGWGAALYVRIPSIARIEYEERVSKLVSKEEVQAAAFNRYRQFREQMLNIPDRMAAILAAESGLSNARCHEILDAEIRRALNDFADVERPA